MKTINSAPIVGFEPETLVVPNHELIARFTAVAVLGMG